MDSFAEKMEKHLREVMMLNFERIDLRFKLNEKNMDLQKSESEKALQIQVKELERRLESLNNEAARIKAMEVKYVQSDLYDAKYMIMEGKLDALSKLVYIGVGIIGILEIGLAMMWVFFEK